jgi:carboxymethylenebutenolidase
MKKLLALVLFFTSICVNAQEGITICHTPAIESFAMLASKSEFLASHIQPLPYVHQSATGKMITLPTPDGGEANAYFLPAAKKSNQWVFVFQEWWGLNDHIKKEAEQYYKDLGNVNVLALDMYDGKLATTSEMAGQYMGAFKADRGEAIIKGALAFAGKDAKIGTVGWCFGGGLSLQASLIAGKQAAACVIYYGMPEKDVNRLKTLQTDVLGIFATQEQWISPKVVSDFEANMKAAGKQLTVKNYDAQHAFANPSNPQYDKEATADAYAHALAFFKARLK